MTADLAVVMDVAEARRLTERIRLTAHSARESLARLQELVERARVGQVHVALGYSSWTAYLADVFGEEPLRLPRDQRQEIVGYLAGEGMSVPAIAVVAGVSDRTVQRDFRSSGQGVTTVTTCEPGPGFDQSGRDFPPEPIIDTTTGEVLDEPTPQKVLGLDGKHYPRPASAAPKTAPRRALTDQFFDAAYDLTKVTERIQRLAADDRWPRNAEQVAAKHRHDLLRARDLLQEVIDRLPSGT